MPDFPRIDNSVEAVSPWSHLSIGGLLQGVFGGSAAGAAWPSANRAIFTPFRLREPITITQIVVGCGITGGGNFDTGIYDRFGNLIISSGSTARSASTEVVANITDTRLGRGQYYMALVSDSTGTFVSIAPANASLLKFGGVKEMATAFPLPSTATFATLSSAYLPAMALYKTGL